MKVKITENKIFKTSHEKSILDSALSAGLVFEYSCKTGRCGVCKTTLLDGEVIEIQPQVALTVEQKNNNQILTCCCVAKSDILIDAKDLSVLHDIKIKTLPAKINSIVQKSSDIVEVFLRLPPGARFKFLPGQYIDVKVANRVSRSYSIANSLTQDCIKLMIKKVKDGVLSQYWFEEASENDLVRIEGPKGTFYIRDVCAPLIFLATGTGIAPIISILQTLEDDDNFVQNNPIYLFWGNRNIEDFVWLPKFEKIKIRYTPVLSYNAQDWKGEKGYVQNVAVNMIKNINLFHVYACGSEKMIQSARSLFVSSGLPENSFYSDAFVSSK